MGAWSGRASRRRTDGGGRRGPPCGPSTSPRLSRPAWEAVLAAVGVGEGTTLLDVACGSGELAALARARGAAVHGIDAAEAMIALARTAVPGADLRVGTLEALPWPDAAFDVVTGFNAFQFAPDMVAALAEAARVTRPRRSGRRVQLGRRGAAGPRRRHPRPAGAGPGRGAGAAPPDRRARRAGGAAPRGGPAPVGRRARSRCPTRRRTDARSNAACSRRATCATSRGTWARRPPPPRWPTAAAPFRRADGSYLFHSTFRWVVAGRD